MAVSQAQKLAKAKYQHEKRSIVAAEVSKEKGSEYRAKAAELGLSLSMLIQRAIESYGTNVYETSEQKPPTEKLTSEQKKILDAVESLPPTARKLLLKFIQELAVNQQREGEPD